MIKKSLILNPNKNNYKFFFKEGVISSIYKATLCPFSYNIYKNSFLETGLLK